MSNEFDLHAILRDRAERVQPQPSAFRPEFGELLVAEEDTATLSVALVSPRSDYDLHDQIIPEYDISVLNRSSWIRKGSTCIFLGYDKAAAGHPIVFSDGPKLVSRDAFLLAPRPDPSSLSLMMPGRFRRM